MDRIRNTGLQDQLQAVNVNFLSFRVDNDDFRAILHSVRQNNMYNFLLGKETKVRINFLIWSHSVEQLYLDYNR